MRRLCPLHRLQDGTHVELQRFCETRALVHDPEQRDFFVHERDDCHVAQVLALIQVRYVLQYEGNDVSYLQQ